MLYSLMAETICNYIFNTIERTPSKILRFILPSYPSGLIVKIGEVVKDYFDRILDRHVEFHYRIAFHLGQTWASEGVGTEQADFEIIQKNGWYDIDNNLTKFRNMLPCANVDQLIIVLVGFEHIEYKGSLQDFHRLDEQTIWEAGLKKSFYSWVTKSHQDCVSPEDGKIEFELISNFLKELYQNGVTDLVGVSEYLGSRDYNGIMDGREAYQGILNDLNFFNLPKMGSLSKRGVKLSFGHYITVAQEFLNYSLYLNRNDRKKTVERIRTFQKERIDDLIQEMMGNYQDRESLITDLVSYIENRNFDALERLKEADFPFINDRILNYKLTKQRERTRPTKVTGLPPEVFLKAIWLTLGDFRRNDESWGVIEEPFSILLKSIQFKHDFNLGDDECNSSAEDFLRHILGGIDEFLEEHLKIEIGGESPIEIPLQCAMSPGEKNNHLNYTPVKTAEPSLLFEVSIIANNKSLTRRFIWALPQFHSSRVLNDLFDLTYKVFTSGEIKNGEALFTISIPYMPELFKSKDEEEANRLVSLSLRDDANLISLVTKSDIISSEERILIDELFYKYQAFISQYNEYGFFCAIKGDCYDGLRTAYQNLCERFLKNSSASGLGPFLLKAFMLVSKRQTEQTGWKWNKYLPAAVVTPLHPAMLEMLLHQYVFLFNSFRYYVKRGLDNLRVKDFTTKAWDHVVDLARIQRPVFGTLVNDDGALDTNVRGYGYIYLVGDCSENATSAVSRFLLEYDSDEEEEITDTDLFRETQESTLVRHLLLDYLELHSHANDGVTIGAFCGQDIQPIIAGVDEYIESIIDNRSEQIYSLRLVIFTDSGDDSTVIKWINAWKERWQAAEISPKKYYYRQCAISISYWVVTDNMEQFVSRLKGMNFDIFIFSNFIHSGSSRFVELGSDVLSISDYQKFPILDKICCRQNGGGMDQQRERILSHGQFRLACFHGEIMERMKTGHQSNLWHLIVGKNDYGLWKEVIDATHKVSAWVICIDPIIDEYLLRLGLAGKREIIGFGTGVGSHGESNFTVSTEQFTIDDVKKKIGSQALGLFKLWDHETAKRIADSIIREASHIGGLSLVRATGPKDSHIHDYFAFSLIRKLLPRDPETFCDEIISLDAFRHWFIDANAPLRPDLLKLKAYIRNGYFDIEAQIIECKLADYSEGYLTKARQQIESGLNHLVNCFQPRRGRTPLGILNEGKWDRPDQRYWWMQLHRLVTSKGSIKHSEYPKALQAMERLGEGLFNITWRAAAVAFWTNHNTTFQSSPEWQFTYDDQEMWISVVTAGGDFVRKVCLENAAVDLFQGSKGLIYNYVEISPLISSLEKVKEDETSEAIVKNQITPVVHSQTEIKVKPENEASLQYPEVKIIGDSSIPDRILLGNNVGGGRDYYWEFGHPDLPNRHILVFGASGTGKTYTIQALLCELGKSGQNSLIVDYTNGFTTKQLDTLVVEKLSPKQHIVRKEPLPINPFRQQCDFIDEITLEEDPSITAQRVTGVFAEVYNFGDQQRSALYNAIRDGVTLEADKFGLNGLINRLEIIQDSGGPTASSATSVISKIQPFIDMNPFGNEDIESWEKLFTDQTAKCHIIQLAGFMKDTARLITEFSLIDLYWYYRARGNKDNPKVIVLDEIQNLDHSLGSPLGQFLTEGRKFGISLILATQTLSNLGKDERDRLFQASHKLFFKPAETEIKSFAQILADSTGLKVDEWIERLSGLKRGECYSLGYALNEATNKLEVNKAFKIRIKALEERF